MFVTLFFISLGTLLLILKNFVIEFFQIFFPNVNWETYDEIIQLMVYLYILIFYFLSFLFFYFEYFKELNFYKKIIENIKIFFKSLFQNNQSSQNSFYFFKDKIFILIFFIGALIRFYKLQFNITYDESATYLDYVNGGFTDLFFYKLPNNHVFHSILAKISVNIFGDNQYTLRLPALIFGLLNIILIYNLGRKIKDRSTGLIASFLMSCSTLIIHFDTIARGYSIKTAFVLLLFYFSLKYLETSKFRFLFLMSVVSSFGFFTITSFIIPFFGILMWLFFELLQKRKQYLNKVIYDMFFLSLMTFIFSVFFYTPTIILGRGIDQFRNIHLTPNIQYPDDILIFFNQASNQFFFSSTIVQSIVIILIGYTYFRKKELFIFLLFQIFSTICIIFIIKTIPPTRILVFLLPLIIIIVSFSISIFFERHKKKLQLLLPFLQILIMTFYIEKKILTNNGFPEFSSVLVFLKELPIGSNIGSNDMLYYKSLKYYMNINDMGYPYSFNTEEINYPFFIVTKKSFETEDEKFKQVFTKGNVQIFKVNK